MRDPFERPEVAANYEQWYQTPAGRRADRLEKQVLGSLLVEFPGARSILEVGCGTGHFSRWFTQQGLWTVGLDRSAAMVAEVRRDPPFGLVLGDGMKLPFRDSAFDLVAFVTTLEFVEDPVQALREARRVATQGLILGVLNAWSILGWTRRVKGWFRPSLYREARFYSVLRLRRLLREALGQEGQRMAWRTTLYPSWFPVEQAPFPWGGFIGLAVKF